MFTYNLNLYFKDRTVEIKTNDIFVLMDSFYGTDDAIGILLVNGITGEVLFRMNENNNDVYCTDEFSLLCLGWVALKSGEEE